LKKRFAVYTVALVIVLLTPFWVYSYLDQSYSSGPASPFYVGIMYCGDTIDGAKLMIDRVKGYTNLFLQSNSKVAFNETELTQVCDYASSAGLSFIVNLGTATYYDNIGQIHPKWTWQYQWLDVAKERWGSKFLGVYYYDEPGGIHADAKWENITGNPKLNQNDTYDTTALVYHWFIGGDQGLQTLRAKNITAFTSDYALYWFDYEAGYDVILAEFTANNNGTQTTAMVRGAANMQNKDWGITITWTESNPPSYLGSADEIYDQMLTAYKSGAKYELIFDYPTYPEDNPYGILNDTYFNAFEKFWKTIHAMPSETQGMLKPETALVLPQNYGWGMRNPNDKIWGAWEPDEKSPVIWNISRVLLSKYSFSLDIIYEDNAYPIGNKYSQVHYWNSTVYG
jgi:hypothetical protein